MIRQQRYPDGNVFAAGDLVRLVLEPGTHTGEAFVRTNLDFAGEIRREIVAFTEQGLAPAGSAWHDVPMHRLPDGRFEIRLPLLDTGFFEAKCFLRHPDGSIGWSDGGNFCFKVESAENAAGNTIYCAFVRQFGGAACWTPAEQQEMEQQAAALDAAGCTVIPPGGTFRQVIARLDHIFDRLGCRILQLLPIHPVPTVYARMGRFGSPFAATDYFAVDPALAEFDPGATPLAQFIELVDAVHARQGRIFLDIPVNHTGWGSRTQAEHPEYFVRDEQGNFVSPGAWGVVWADLCKLDYRNPEVPQMMAGVFLYWCRHGVDGFRCDAGYMLPAAAWTYITAKVREEYPDTVFLLEGLGGRMEVQEDLLLRHGLDWAYSELFQNYQLDQVAGCRDYVTRCGRNCGTLVNFAETHDNTRLAAVSPGYAAMRCVLCALLAENGGFGFANGVELLATERIDVHGAAPLDWQHHPDLVHLLRRLNALLAGHPAFFRGSRTEWIGQGHHCAVLLRRPLRGEPVLVLVNLDDKQPHTARWDSRSFTGQWDLLTDQQAVHEPGRFNLAPGGYACLSERPFALPEPVGEPARVLQQRLTHMAWKLRRWFNSDDTPDPAALAQDPWEFCHRLSGQAIPPVTRYRLGRDEHRLVPVPAGDLLLLEGSMPFRAELIIRGKTVRAERSLQGGKHHFTLFLPPREALTAPEVFDLRITEFPAAGKPARRQARILELPEAEDASWPLSFTHADAVSRYAFAANDRGGMALIPAAWGTLGSKYDALLAANGHAGCPVDRRVLFTRCRGWLTADGFSCAIDERSLVRFSGGMDNRAEWEFALSLGQGRTLNLVVAMQFAFNGDAVRFRFTRADRDDRATGVRIILRPDLEDRINHGLTKAYTGPERHFPTAITARPDGFRFAPAPERYLDLRLRGGRFVSQPEWQYMVDLPLEKRYGQDHCTDLFSPGYLEYRLDSGGSCELTASAMCDPERLQWPPDTSLPDAIAPLAGAEAGLRHFVVRRDDWQTIIAGYPWFLDWGRDTLIALRGLIAAGRREDAEAILRTFATFEECGTIPNVIHGKDVSNRDTSDAPLWLFVAADDYIRRFQAPELLDMGCGGRSFREVLSSIVRWYRQGTPNGIRVDDASGLVFSPSHFTWMDTNYPAGTPRMGYPIEIQALWIAALAMLERHTGDRNAAEWRQQAQHALLARFYLTGSDRFSDCLHCHGYHPAADAVPDDHIRSNQLLAVTLGAITDRQKAATVVRSAEQLLVPGAIRSLADRPVQYELPVTRNGVLLNDPRHPYRGRYEGPEDTSRKVAYHNGTAWLWPYPSFCEALYLLGGEPARARAASLLHAASYMAGSGVPGFLSEIADGDAPHREQGCPAQAWSMSEFYRVARMLDCQQP